MLTSTGIKNIIQFGFKEIFPRRYAVKVREKIKNSEKPDAMHFIASVIVKYRYIIFLVFILAAVYCALSMGRVRVNSDLTAFLPKNAETRRGLTVMQDEFVTYGTASVMISNVTYEKAQSVAEEISALDHVTDVVFDDSRAHYVSASALFTISFDGVASDPDVQAAMGRVKELAEPFDHYISTNIGSDFNKQLQHEMVGIMLIAVAVIVGVLLFTSRSYFEVVIFGIVFVFAALLNMGTNFWLGEISSITNSIAVIMQLALAIDYAIIFAHRYQDEAESSASEREALIEALSKSIIEISSSSLTTIAGLAALTIMQFRLGRDLGIVLAKGIICSMITVFLLMPGLIMLFPKALRKTQHRSLIPNIEKWGGALMKTRVLFVVLFALVLPFAIVFSNRLEYAFADRTIDEIVYSESRAAMHKIDDTFEPDTAIAVIVPGREYEKEKALLFEAEKLDGIKTASGLANIEIEPGLYLTDDCSPRRFADLLDIDIELSRLLYQAYGLEHEQYQAIFGTSGEYEVPLADMFLYLFEKIDQGFVMLTDGQKKQLGELRGTLERGVEQLRGEKADRMVFTAGVPAEGAESVALVEKLRDIAAQYYDRDSVLVVGDITSARDLRDSYKSDILLINLLTIAFVYIILLFTFRSVIGAAVLVFVIQGSIWINFSFPYLSHTSCSFVTNMIVSAIQMGATIDYAIVLMSRYTALKTLHDNKAAMRLAVNESFPTVLTSGSIMTMAGFLIAFRVSDVYVGHIGLTVGRGALISVVLVLTVLPQLIVLADKAIEKTSFRIKLDIGDERS